MTKIKFKGSSDLSDNKVVTKKIGIAKDKAIFFFVNILRRKYKNEPIIIFINIIITMFDGFVRFIITIIKARIISKNISFFPNFSLACIIIFNYNRKLWLK